MKEEKKKQIANMIECTVPGCGKVFNCFENMELHLSAGSHSNTLQNETLYDNLRKKWANTFQTIDIIDKGKKPVSSESFVTLTLIRHRTAPENKMGWALNKPSTSSWFSTNVRTYLTANFDIGEKKACKLSSSDAMIQWKT